ncbi:MULTISPECIES: MFS transporter [Nitrospirillum]|uniref:MFS transporter n=1 Tax=Nitrospirillum amazonense TaxID=28077 RepID=A0A560FHJ2_9PROT|nr:MFS transporter [Nitrospirillum amazonense]MEC4590519.1 MFS transporter [Nitrospirillum amazonense]TWB21073.1 MFS transporter [Nitrospirillum amazonense]
MASMSVDQPITVAEAAPVGARWVLATLSLCVLLSSLGTSVANVALPTLARALGAPFQQVQWVVLAYLLAMTTLIVSVGRLGDLTGRRRLLLIGLALFTGASGFCGLAPGLGALVAARAAQGLGASAMTALALAFVGGTVPKDRIGRAMGLMGTMSAVGTALGPSLGGALIAAWGWRAIFLVNLPLGGLALLLAWWALPADRGPADRGPANREPADRMSSSSDRPRFDAAGTVLLGGTLALYALAMTLGRGHWGVLNLALLAAAVVGAGLFALVEARVVSPLVRLGLLRDPVVGPGLAGSGAVATVMATTFVVGPFYLARAVGLSPAGVGLVMSAGPLMSALAGVPAGRLVDRFGAACASVAGLAAMVAGTVLMALAGLGPQGPIWGVAAYVGSIAVLTAGYALFQAANNTAVMSGVPAGRRGVVSGILNLARNLGLITGASALGAVFALASGVPDITTAPAGAVAAGMRVTFLVAGGLVALALLVTAKARRHSSLEM